ncbi:hypothetical protein ACU6TU_03090 [Halomonas sp. LS-001]
MASHHKPTLDLYEGLGEAYNETWLTVTDLASDRQFEMQAFTALGLRLYTWYKRHVLAGAREYGLPGYYLRALEGVNAHQDENAERHAREMALYAPMEPLMSAT